MRLFEQYGITRAELAANMGICWLAYFLRGTLEVIDVNVWVMTGAMTVFSVLAGQFLFEKYTQDAIRRVVQ